MKATMNTKIARLYTLEAVDVDIIRSQAEKRGLSMSAMLRTIIREWNRGGSGNRITVTDWVNFLNLNVQHPSGGDNAPDSVHDFSPRRAVPLDGRPPVAITEEERVMEEEDEAINTVREEMDGIRL